MKRWLASFVLVPFMLIPAIAHANGPIGDIDQQMDSDTPPAVEMDREGDEVTLDWGPHPNTGYQLSIVDSYEGDNGWNIVYELSYPPEDDQSGILHTQVHPRATTTVPEEVQNVNLFEQNNGDTFAQLPNTAIDERHSWTLEFDEELAGDDISNDLIYVMDENNERQENVILISSPSQITVFPPPDGYDTGELYRLYIDPSLENEMGQSLEQGYKQSFYISEDTDYHEWQPPNMIESQTFSFESPSQEDGDDNEADITEGERIYSIFPMALEGEGGEAYVIRHLEPDHEEEVVIPPVTTPSFFLPVHPFLPYPHHYGFNQES
ncbi:hypothetical protein [Natribacillus halophilus]|uniref:SbsA Ig-like domain-containing protein n=1 Tax=Natribacillus halophilus TaxID=549003 RepID=A0A1G8NTF8_9BACI|nr:hypothetical protein [Natribacillus halophilus]SDI83504.1 hypothetical protein SAMN04488123_10722 [Natribacillus halophilus]